ncbi:MAG: DUF3795 domain-containing protein [Candidatus Cloacimonetes bacterium]|jgi:hypothetical protein|nr:DUF3795 domain-containing protein [Candidatus Cloacimonadota bacterium]MCK9335084.1 DUF3795 domain-containing protein [Candidatus Cloacimonadota bacterium]MDD4034157.1 DUF3795 domain-containing protein [Candidatus Cloacimonadota bacterium]HPF08131.1 DUF3795 domain-containing protein [Candidatus Cloacimonadota bacterium]
MLKLISACGLDCFTCECREAYLNGDEARKADIALRWSKMYDNEFSAKDIACEGCMEGSVHFAWCEKCPIRACAEGKGYKSCAECADFPCEHNSWLYTQVPSAKEAIQSLR